MHTETKTILDSQIAKIFSIIDKSSDNQEICKIALDTLIYKCIETPVFIYPILSNLIDLVIKGNLKLIEDSSLLLEAFFDDFNTKVLNKVLLNDLFKLQFKSIIEDCNDLTPLCLLINIHEVIEPFNELSFVDFSLFESGFDVTKLECLYAKEKDSSLQQSQWVPFNKMEMEVLFPNNDDVRMEVEKNIVNSLTVNQSFNEGMKKSKAERIKLTDYYSLKSKQFQLKDDSELVVNSAIKKKKISETETQSIYEFKLNPFYSFVLEVLKYNSLSCKQRNCSITLLKLLHQYFPKMLYVFYSVRVVYSHSNKRIEDIVVDHAIQSPSRIRELIQVNIISKLIVNSILDKVIDYNNDDYICLGKELNLKLVSQLLEDTHSLEINAELSRIMMTLLDKFFSIKDDWQPLFAVLTLFKYLFLSSSYVADNCKLFNLLSKLMTTDYGDILNLTIQMLDKMLEANLLSNFIEKEQLRKVFLLFLQLITRYDDIESGVRYYFSCLYHFIVYFTNENSLDINSLVGLLNNDFIFHSMNKITSVRIKYFEVMNNLLTSSKAPSSASPFLFEFSFIEQNALIAYQGLCIEQDKHLLKTQQAFIMNVIVNSEDYISIFLKNSRNVLQLLLCDNITDLKHFFIPTSKNEDIKEIEDLYRSFFLNQMQSDLIPKAYERKVFYVTPVLALVLKIKVDFIQVIYSELKVNLEQAIVIRDKILLLLKVYLYYLEFIEFDSSKILILNDDVLKLLSENVTLSELPIKVTKSNIENKIGMNLKFFIDFSGKTLGKTHLVVTSLMALYSKLNNERTLDLRAMNEGMKNVYDTIKQSGKNEVLKHCCEHVKFLKDAIEAVEHNQNLVMLRQRIRGYASACLFIHSAYLNVKYSKISSITNSFLNCLKSSNKESKMFVKYLLKLITSLDNKETITKILFTFLENSFKAYADYFQINCCEGTKESNSMAMTASIGLNQSGGGVAMGGTSLKDDEKKANGSGAIEGYVFLPVKYFFGEFAKYHKYLDIQKIIKDYHTALIIPTPTPNQSQFSTEKKMITLLFLLASIKLPTNCMEFSSFYPILLNASKHSKDPHLVDQIATILISSTKLFSDINTYADIKEMISKLYASIDVVRHSLEHNIFIFKILERISCDNTTSTASIDFIFIVLSYINNKHEEIRSNATIVFSKLMKIISMLKFESNYEDIAKCTSVVSLDFITKIFTQNIYDAKELKVMIKETLRNYQLIGINWLLFFGGFGLGLALCDDMGLGKTIQTLIAVTHASIEYKEKHSKAANNLIICPSTLILNWVSESKKFFHHSDLALIPVDSNLVELKPAPGARVSVFITSYEKVRENSNNLFTSLDYFYLVLDEAHIIKNPKTKTYQSIRRISSERRIILTGTPIQNNVMELWSLFDFLMPGFLGNENDFEIKYHKKIHSNIKKLNLEEKLQENIFQTSLMEIRKRIKPFVLRRLKSDVLKELPEKMFSDSICEMLPSQRELYSKWLKVYEEPHHKESTFALLDKLRKICNHPFLVEKEEVNSTSVFNVTQSPAAIASSSGKLKSLEEILISRGFEAGNAPQSALNSEDKILIFTQYKHMCFFISVFLEEKFKAVNFLQLTSDTKVKDRTTIAMRFNSDPTISILLLTTSIGGLGINLPSANVVVMYDHNWNPTIDMQAIDRAHRIGQKKVVEVYRLITKDSIEEQLISLQTFKKYIANNIIDTSRITENKVNTGSIMDSFEQFSNDKALKQKQRKAIKKKSKLDELMDEGEERCAQEELEIEYLKNLIEKD